MSLTKILVNRKSQFSYSFKMPQTDRITVNFLNKKMAKVTNLMKNMIYDLELIIHQKEIFKNNNNNKND